jgi:hypothetical protein
MIYLKFYKQICKIKALAIQLQSGCSIMINSIIVNKNAVFPKEELHFLMKKLGQQTMGALLWACIVRFPFGQNNILTITLHLCSQNFHNRCNFLNSWLV